MMQPAASNSPATRPKPSHCRRERPAVTTRSLPPECPAWASPSGHPVAFAARNQAHPAQPCGSFTAHGAPFRAHGQACRPLRRSRSPLDARRLRSVAQPRGSRGGIAPAAGTSPMVTRRSRCAVLGLDASAVPDHHQRARPSSEPRACSASGIWRTGRSTRDAGPTVGAFVRGRSPPARNRQLEKHPGRASPRVREPRKRAKLGNGRARKHRSSHAQTHYKTAV